MSVPRLCLPLEKKFAKVQPPMYEEEMVPMSSRAQEGEFYSRMVSVVRTTFIDLIKSGNH